MSTYDISNLDPTQVGEVNLILGRSIRDLVEAGAVYHDLPSTARLSFIPTFADIIDDTADALRKLPYLTAQQIQDAKDLLYQVSSSYIYDGTPLA